MEGEFTSVEEFLFESREELKRVEHIIYVSLKYTRTTDVLRNALLRFISFFDLLIHSHMIRAKEEGLIDRIPKSPALKANRLAEMHAEDEQFQRFITYYFFLKELLKSNYNKINEYRRHVGMVFDFEKHSVIINIDSLETCEYYAHKFFNYSRKLLGFSSEE